MAGSLYSENWYRVASLKLKLRRQTLIHRQQFRGEIWYVVQDQQSGQFHRLSKIAYRFVCLMDGKLTISEIWGRLTEEERQTPPTQDDVIQLLATLHNADLLIGDHMPDMGELDRRISSKSRKQLASKVMNPLSVKVPLIDPDRFLNATVGLVRPLFSIWGALLWIACVVAGGINVAMNQKVLAQNFVDQAISADNILIMLFCYPLIKILHELGHAYATTVRGGEVHELGLFFLVFIPVPYVDATSSAAFQNKYHRALVGGAGILVELAIAAIASFVWVNVEPGYIRAFAFNAMLIGGISTLLFNGNPLLKLDGYYVLSDLVEIPNLATRSGKYILYLIQRYLFGVPELVTPVTARGEKSWFVFYAIASTVYRLFVSLGIALFVAGQFFFIGVLLAMVSVTLSVIWPLMKGIYYVFTSPALNKRRSRAITFLGLFSATVLAWVAVIPVPYATVTEGIIWPGDNSAIAVRSSGFLKEVFVEAGETVKSGQKILTLEDPQLLSTESYLKIQRVELQRRFESLRYTKRVQARILSEKIGQLDEQIESIATKIANLTLRAEKNGRWLTQHQMKDLFGSFFQRGSVIGYVVGEHDLMIKTSLPQSEVDLVRRRTKDVTIRLVDAAGTTSSARILRETPAAVEKLPHMALATQGGGHVTLDPREASKLRPLQPTFIIDVDAQGQMLPDHLGQRVYVRFAHEDEAIGYRIMRSVRQLFLKRLGI